MLKAWKRTVRVALVPLALVALVIGTSIPASAATITPTTQSQLSNYHAKPLSLNW